MIFAPDYLHIFGASYGKFRFCFQFFDRIPDAVVAGLDHDFKE